MKATEWWISEMFTFATFLPAGMLIWCFD